jgi:hypothetical protein
MKKFILLLSLLLASCSTGNRIEKFAKSLGEIDYIYPQTCEKRVSWAYRDSVNGVDYIKEQPSQCVYEYEIKTLDNKTFILKEYDMDNLNENLFIYYDKVNYFIINENGKKLDFNVEMKRIFGK